MGRHILAALVWAALLALPSPGWAWIETRIESAATTVDVGRDGKAVVTHELALRIRGGPLERYVLVGVDGDAEPLPDASLSPALPGAPSSSVIPLLVRVDDGGTMVLEPDHPKGVRRGSYALRVSYRTDLVARGLLAREGGGVSLRWTGPRFEDGIASAKVVFRVGRAPNPPRLPEASRHERLGIDSEADGVFLSTLRRAHDADELDVVRPHVARGEPVVWRIVTDPKAFDVFEAPPPVAVAPTSSAASEAPAARGVLLTGLFGAALAFALLVAAKWTHVARNAALAGVDPRPLVPLPAAIRAALAGAALVAGVGVGWVTDWALASGGFVVAAMLLSTHRQSVPRPVVRGPGEWKVVASGEVLERPSRWARRPTGAWLDAGQPHGLLLLLVLVGGAAFAAHVGARHSPYHAMLVLLASAAFVPVFCTGRASQLPADPLESHRGSLAWLAKRLRRDRRLAIAAICRFPRGSDAPDELRLQIDVRDALPGLVGLEIAYEHPPSWSGPAAHPCVLVRAADDSPCYRMLPRSLVWTRGRTPHERVAVVRPKVPSRSFVLALVRRLVAHLARPRAVLVGEGRRAGSGARRPDVARRAGTAAPAAREAA